MAKIKMTSPVIELKNNHAMEQTKVRGIPGLDEATDTVIATGAKLMKKNEAHNAELRYAEQRAAHETMSNLADRPDFDPETAVAEANASRQAVRQRMNANNGWSYAIDGRAQKQAAADDEALNKYVEDLASGIQAHRDYQQQTAYLGTRADTIHAGLKNNPAALSDSLPLIGDTAAAMIEAGALDPDQVEQWKQETTLRAFTAATSQMLIEGRDVEVDKTISGMAAKHLDADQLAMLKERIDKMRARRDQGYRLNEETKLERFHHARSQTYTKMAKSAFGGDLSDEDLEAALDNRSISTAQYDQLSAYRLVDQADAFGRVDAPLAVHRLMDKVEAGTLDATDLMAAAIDGQITRETLNEFSTYLSGAEKMQSQEYKTAQNQWMREVFQSPEGYKRFNDSDDILLAAEARRFFQSEVLSGKTPAEASETVVQRFKASAQTEPDRTPYMVFTHGKFDKRASARRVLTAKRQNFLSQRDVNEQTDLIRLWEKFSAD